MAIDRKLIRSGVMLGVGTAPAPGRAVDILIEGGTIRAIAPDIAAADAEVIDATDMIVMPGFVDTHRHTWQTAFRGIGSDWSLGQYANGMHGTLKPFFTPEDMYIANHLGRIEALHSGITTMLDWSHGILSPLHADAAAEALIDAPGRSVFAYCGNLQAGSNDEPIASELRRFREGRFQSDDGLVTLALGLRGPQYSKMQTTIDDVRLARELDLPVTVHGGSASWGKYRPIAQMHQCGLLDERTTIVHCNTLADDELSMMADCGCHASISPDAEIQMGFGWPATRRLLDVGIRPSLSIDDCAAVCGDMFRTMHTTLVVQRGLDNETVENPTEQVGLALDSCDVVEFATLAGARACGLERRIGTVEVGKDADLLLLRTDELALFPLTHPMGQIVSSGHPGLVDTVLVRGQVVKAGGKMLGVDLPRLRRRTLESQARILERANAGRSPADRIVPGGSWQPGIGAFGSDSNKMLAIRD